VATGPISANAQASSATGQATATASAEVSGITLFGGEVSIGQVVARVNVSATSGKGSGDISGSYVSGLTVNGTAVDVGGGSAALGDWGTASGPSGGASAITNGYRGSVTGLTITLSADHGGMPAGTTIQIGYAEASAVAERPPPPPPPPPVVAPPPPPANLPPPPPPSIVLPAPTNIKVKIGKSGYVFPVYGPASFGNTFQAARASTGWHHGEDIFAPFGAPILAVADGEVFSVGWNDVGGNRLWLQDRKGNQFYYAHLSAFSPLAVNGAQVKAGDVLGFVGNTGDAESTPPHLHFEIHPAELLSQGYDGVVAPYEYLIAWQRLENVNIVAGRLGLSVARISSAPPPGAYLLSSSDVSTSRGLGTGALRRALARALEAQERLGDGAPAAAAVPPASAP
jgi:murein DD-endopeptidase MepM/ murein hydrolase activator NlpD